MTMKAWLANAGNLTGDKLTVLKMTADGPHKITIKRGEMLDLFQFMGHDEESAPAIRIICEKGTGRYVGEPSVVMFDQPENE